MGALNEQKKAMNGAKVLVLGVAYKQDIDDYRESPAIRVIDSLRKLGAEVCFYDPYIAQYREARWKPAFPRSRRRRLRRPTW